MNRCSLPATGYQERGGPFMLWTWGESMAVWRIDRRYGRGPKEKEFGMGIWVFVWCIGNRLFSHKTIDRFHRIADPLIVDRIVHILTVFVSNQYASVLQNPKML